MKNKYILVFFILVSLFIKNSFALQITKVSGPKTSPWIEIFNNSDSVKNIKDLKLYTKSATNTSTHGVSLGNKATSFDIQANSYFILADDPNKSILSNLACQVFDTSFDLIVGQSLVYDDLEYSITSADSLTSTSCDSGVVQPPTTSTSTASSTNSTSTVTENSTTNTVYIYVPSNNQNKYGDIQVLLPEEKIVPAGADSEYLVRVLDSQKNILTGLDFNWSFGDGGEKFDSKVNYHYTYPGEYILIASADGYMGGAQAKMKVIVVSPDVKITKVGIGGKENYIDLQNNTDYDLFLSNFYLNIDNKFYKLPKNFVIEKKKSVHVSGEALGFKLPALYVSLNYPDKNLLTDYSVKQEVGTSTLTATSSLIYDNSNKNIYTSLNISSSSTNKANYYNTLYYKEKTITDLKNRSIVVIKEPMILKRLSLDTENSAVVDKNENVKNLENVKKDKVVDIGLIKWLKSLIY
jgi:hypothetical protein